MGRLRGRSCGQTAAVQQEGVVRVLLPQGPAVSRAVLHPGQLQQGAHARRAQDGRLRAPPAHGPAGMAGGGAGGLAWGRSRHFLCSLVSSRVDFLYRLVAGRVDFLYRLVSGRVDFLCSLVSGRVHFRLWVCALIGRVLAM